MKTKAELRKHYLQQRELLSNAALQQRSRQVCQQFFAHIPLAQVRVLHTYLPMSSQRELDPLPIISRLRSSYPHIRLVISRTQWQQRQMEHVYWDKEVKLVENKWGIPEPVGGESCPAEQIDAVLVPLLAFDKAGHRLGYGAGFYDRFLASCSPAVLGIGLSLFPPLSDSLPGIFPTDIALTHCVTSEEVYIFS